MVKVDQKKCIGCGLCVSMCPEVFRFNEEGKSEAYSQDNPACAADAAAGCPVVAITL
ncbi:MAG: ferredoxin [Bacillota bacterium]